MSTTTINQSMSLFIAYVFPNIGLHRIINIFQDAKIGLVSRVDFIKKIDKNGKPFNNIYVHFHRWFDSEEAQKFQDSIKDPEAKTTLEYDGPWFWIILENKFKKQENKQEKQPREVKENNNNMYRSLPNVQRKFTLDLSEDCVVKQIDPKLIERITASAAATKPPHHKSRLFNNTYWHQPAEEILQEKTSALLAQILKIQKDHAHDIEEMKKKIPSIEPEDNKQNELEYLREQNRQLQQELDNIKEKK